MRSLLSLALFVFVSSVFASDLLVVRGGREIRGRFLEESKTHLTFYTDYGKKIQIHKSRISVLLRNGEVLAINPVVGTLVGIKADNDTSKSRSAASEIPKMDEKSKTMEPVTQNVTPPIAENSREVASTLTAENIPTTPMGLRVGVTLGVIQSNASTGSPTQNRIGAEGGVVTEVPFVGQTYLQPELLLSQSGYQDGDTSYKYSFVRIPVFLKYRHLLNDQFALVGMAGPSLGFRSEAKSEVGGVSTDLKSTTKSTLIGADLGLGTEYLFSSNLEFFFNIRYSTQLNNLDTTVGATNPVKLRQFSFLTGFLFAL